MIERYGAEIKPLLAGQASQRPVVVSFRGSLSGSAMC
jgi:hypothetical protein